MIIFLFFDSRILRTATLIEKLLLLWSLLGVKKLFLTKPIIFKSNILEINFDRFEIFLQINVSLPSKPWGKTISKHIN
jgi:hypothetical protein